MDEPQHAGQYRRNGWVPCATSWRKGLLLGVLFVLMSLCHGPLASVTTAASLESPAAASVTDDERGAFRDCAMSKRLVALSERRGSPSAALDVPVSLLGFTEHLPEVARGLRTEPIPLPENHRAFLQVFRI